MKRLIPILLIIIIASGCQGDLILRDIRLNKGVYPMFGEIPERNFYSETQVDTLIPLWDEQSKGGFGNVSFTVNDVYLFTADEAGKVSAYDRLTGKLKGSRTYDGAVNVTPCLYRMRMFFIVNLEKEPVSELHYYDYYENKTISKIKIEGPCSNEMIFDSTGLYILSDWGELLRVNLIGQVDWKTETKTRTYSSPAKAGNKIYAGNTKGEIIVFDAETGSLVKKEKIANYINTGILIKDNKGFAGSRGGMAISFDAETLDTLWTKNLGTEIKAYPAADENNVYFSTLAGDLYALNRENGRILWTLETEGLFNSAPVITDRQIIQPDYDKKLLVIDKIDGSLIYTIETEYRVTTSPLLYENILYSGEDKGKITAYKTGAE